MRIYCFAFLMAFAIFSCQSPEIPENLQKEEFRIRIEPDYLRGNALAWAFLHDLDGNPLDFKPFSNNSSLAFEIDSKLHRFHLTLVEKHQIGNITGYFVRTVSNISSENEFILGLKEMKSGNPFNQVGEFEVNISGDQLLGPTSISNSMGHISTTLNFKGFQSYAKMYSTENSDQYIVTTRSATGDTKFAKISSPQIGAVYNLNFETDLLPFDKILTIPNKKLDKLIYSVKVLEKKPDRWKESFWLHTNIFFEEQVETEFKFGYLNEFPYYQSAFIATVSNQHIAGFEKVGSAPISLELPVEKEINIHSTSIGHTAFTSDMVFNHWSGHYRLIDETENFHFNWNVLGESSGFKLKAFPIEFTAQHPKFANLEMVVLASLQVSQSSKNYEELVKGKYVELNVVEEYQEYYLKRMF